MRPEKEKKYLLFVVILSISFTLNFVYIPQVKAQENIGETEEGTKELEEMRDDEKIIKEPLLPQELQKETTEFKLKEIKKESWIEQIKNLQVPSQLKIISRNQWGANENWRFVEKLDEK
ncbi:MAG: hypothetical protein COY82_02145, partial [Parcubacteria group bacterium CG_4_10_14_0_8_um_filter_35_7]